MRAVKSSLRAQTWMMHLDLIDALGPGQAPSEGLLSEEVHGGREVPAEDGGPMV